MIVRASPWDRQAEVRTKISDAEYAELERLAELHELTPYAMARELLRSALALASKRAPAGAAVADGDPAGPGKFPGERLGATKIRAADQARHPDGANGSGPDGGEPVPAAPSPSSGPV